MTSNKFLNVKKPKILMTQDLRLFSGLESFLFFKTCEAVLNYHAEKKFLESFSIDENSIFSGEIDIENKTLLITLTENLTPLNVTIFDLDAIDRNFDSYLYENKILKEDALKGFEKSFLENCFNKLG